MNTNETATVTTPAAAPALLSNTIAIGSIGIRVLEHATEAGSYFVQARDLRFNFPRAENLTDALRFLGVFPPSDRAVVVGGMFAGITLKPDELRAGNAVARFLADAVDAWKAAQVAKMAADLGLPGFETPEA